MRKPKRVSKRALSTLNPHKIKDQWLCKSFHVKSTGAVETSYLLEPSGRRVAPKCAEDAIDAGLLVPANDGLFGTSQTWVPKMNNDTGDTGQMQQMTPRADGFS